VNHLPGIAKRRQLSLMLCVAAALVSLSALSSSPAYSAPPSLLRFVEGVDSAPTPMPASEIVAQLNDPWATLILRQGTFPSTLEQALAALNQLNSADGGVPAQQSYFV
jgi:hypothetical protein